MDDLFEEESSQEQESQSSPETLAPITISLPISADRSLESVTLLKLPPFTMVQKDHFDPSTYSERSDLFPNFASNAEDQMSPDSSEMRAFKAYNVIRHSTQTAPQTNSQLIRWSDGSLSLKVGKDHFDVSTVAATASNNSCSSMMLFQDVGQDVLAPFGSISSKMTARPFCTSSAAHKRWTAALRCSKGVKERKVKYTVASKAPELEKEQAERQEQQRLKLQRKQEAKRRVAMRSTFERTKLTRNFLEDDEEEEAEEDSDVEVYAEERDSELLLQQQTDASSSDEEDQIVSSRLLMNK